MKVKEEAKTIYEEALRGKTSKEEAIKNLKALKARLYLSGTPGIGRGRLNRLIDSYIKALESDGEE